MTKWTNPIGLASGVLVGCDPETIIDAAARARFASVGLWFDPEVWTTGRLQRIRRALAATSLSVIDIEVVRLTAGPISDNVRRIVEISAEIGCPNILVVGADHDRPSLTDSYAALCAIGEQHRVRICIEFMLFSAVPTLDDACQIVGAASSPAAAVLIDPLHLDRAGSSTQDVVALPREWLSYAQFCDAPASHIPPENHEALLQEARDDRLLPGDGVLPLGDLLDAFPAGLPLSVELRSRRLREDLPDPVERARAVRTATERFLRGHQ